MKFTYIGFLLFCAFFHFLIPMIYFHFYGFWSGFYAPKDMLYDPISFYSVIGMNVGGLLIAASVVYFLPNSKKISLREAPMPMSFYLICISFGVFFVVRSGGYQGVLKGELLGTWMSYMGLFLNSTVAFVLTISYFNISRMKLAIVLLIQALSMALSGSRGAPVYFISNFFIFMSSYQSKEKIRIFIVSIFITGLFSTLLYNFATNIRAVNLLNDDDGSVSQKQNIEKSLPVTNSEPMSVGDKSVASSVIAGTLKDSLDISFHKLKPIMIRISLIEAGMIPVIFKKRFRNSEGLQLFYEKYSLKNQLYVFKNFLFPKRVKRYLGEKFPGAFDYDVMPNQYFRSMFLGITKEEAAKNYLSINITFPVFVYMYSNALIATLAYAAALIIFYLFITHSAEQFPTVALMFFSGIYTFIYFFDLSDYLVTLFRSGLGLFAFWLFYKLVAWCVDFKNKFLLSLNR